jgi:hypothetical protein
MSDRGATAALVASLVVIVALTSWAVTGPTDHGCPGGWFSYRPLDQRAPVTQSAC